MIRLALALLATTLVACAGGNDNNLIGTTNSGTNNTSGECEDLDGDGFDGRTASCPNGRDCDDTNRMINPAQPEVCGDGLDNDCDGQTDEGCMAMECVDADGDRYGVGPGCFGTDCDDTNPDINPGAMEICGNGVDENCSGQDLECPTNCIDEDGDGYGAEGSTDCVDEDGNVVTEIDCDDGDPDRYPGNDEVCDGKDNDCDGTVDECPLPGQACSGPGGECIGGAGAECENHDDCAGQFLKCDPSQNPKVCRAGVGGPCSDENDCVDGLSCGADSTCTGDFCAAEPCAGNDPYDVCDPAGICVECPHFDPDPVVQDAECEGGQQCVPGGWCAFSDQIHNDSGLDLDITTEEEYYWVNWYMADCWLTTRPEGNKKMCSAFFVPSDAIRPTEDGADSAYTDGHIDNALSPAENDALHDIWGEGLFNRKEIDWKADPEPGTAKEYCLWYQPGGFLSGETLVLDKCENFSP